MNAMHAAPNRSCPSWPMFTRPARVEMIDPSATSSSGAASARVSPQRPGLPQAAVEQRAGDLAPRSPGDGDEEGGERERQHEKTAYDTKVPAELRSRSRAGAIGVARVVPPAGSPRLRAHAADPTEEQTEAFGGRLGAGHLADHCTAGNTTIRSARSRISSSSVEMSSTAMPSAAAHADGAHVLDRADVEATGGLRGDEHLRVGGSARGRARPVAGCRPRGSTTARRDPRLDLELLHELGARSAETLLVEEPSAGDGSRRSSMRFSATDIDSTQPES